MTINSYERDKKKNLEKRNPKPPFATSRQDECHSAKIYGRIAVEHISNCLEKLYTCVLRVKDKKNHPDRYGGQSSKDGLCDCTGGLC